jgi:hypothetical protein
MSEPKMRVSRWRRWQWSRQAKRQLAEEITANLVWPGVKPGPMKIRIGSTLTVTDVFTLVVTGEREIRISPPMTDEQMRADHEAGIRAKYGLVPK